MRASTRHGPRVAAFVLSVIVTGCTSAPAVAQAPAPSSQGTAVAKPAPQIQTSATEFVEITPDRAVISFSVETRGRTAAAASAENARIQSAVLDSLRRLGVPQRDIRTQGLSVMPEYQYPRDGGRPTVIGYQARNTIQVELPADEKVGSVIDAALAKGVTSVGGLHFFAKDPEPARQEAMKKAVARARADAEAIAAAAGGRLGAVIELVASSESPDVRQMNFAPMMMARAERGDASTPVEPGVVRVTAVISAKFEFVPSR